MNLPNKLTTVRILLLPVLLFIYFMDFEWGTISLGFTVITTKQLVIFMIFVVASLTDLLDGQIARRYNLVTTFGKFVDPIADKLLTNTCFVLLTLDGKVPPLAFILMFWRDLIVDGVRMLASSKGQVIAAGMTGKLKTVLQMLAIILLFLNLSFGVWVVWAALVISLISGFMYLYQARELIFESI